MTEFDAAIVGAGPSGTSTAITLAKRGYRVVLIDRATFPRDKLCGDFVNPINWRVFEELKVDQDILDRQHTKVSTFRITAADGAEAASCLLAEGAEQQYGLGLRRYHLDHVLVERAKKDGVTVIEGGKVNGIDRDTKGWSLRIDRAGEIRTLGAKILVGADGRNSGVARRLGVALNLPKGRSSVGFEIQLSGIRGLDGSVEIHQFPGGYAGMVRVDKDTVNLCFTINRDLLRESVSFAGLRNRYLNGSPFLRKILSNSEPRSELRSVSPVYFPPRRCFGDGFVLVGDAARVTEPVTGEGIYLALRSGQLAADTIDAALRRSDFSGVFFGQYDLACRREFRNRVRLNYLMRVLSHHPSWLSLLIRVSSKRRSLLDSLVESVCGLTHRAEAN